MWIYKKYSSQQLLGVPNQPFGGSSNHYPKITPWNNRFDILDSFDVSQPQKQSTLNVAIIITHNSQINKNNMDLNNVKISNSGPIPTNALNGTN